MIVVIRESLSQISWALGVPIRTRFWATYYKQALLCSIELGSIKCNLKTAKIGILVALKSVIYFRFVSEIIGVEPIVLTSRTKKIL